MSIETTFDRTDLHSLYIHEGRGKLILFTQSVHRGAAKFVQIDELCLVGFEFIHFNISLLMSGERHKVLDTLDQYHLLGSGVQSTTNQIYIVFKQRK